MLNDILKNMNLFVDGRGYAGNVEELTPPKLTMKTEEFRNGGMDAPVDVEMGMEKLEASFSLTKYDAEVLKLYGLAPGQTKPFTFRGSISSEDGTEKSVVVQLQGMLKELDPGSWKPGERASLKGMIAVRYYKHSIGGLVIHEIDVPNMVRIINGIDQLALTRRNLGM
ncbi:phage major tail tube protein [Methylomonas sp. EFPC1]|uniref:phage major tail tube protein n=1 Tax=Methylomonas sp. EFPC1 TaxID=2812647 RepID=UPI001967414B|nr:phage major tail tube protein [Methylomonas sp. EFPC1]QSB03237.1 phage major tail tube protein [Methylomonas sp. EFPC1]